MHDLSPVPFVMIRRAQVLVGLPTGQNVETITKIRWANATMAFLADMRRTQRR